MIKAIVCVDNNFGIGKNNGLLFNIKEDMRFFRETTKNSVVVCGLNTLLSFPGQKPLKNRTTIVMCPEGYEREDCICVHDFDKLVTMLKCLSVTTDIYVIGGGMMYATLLPYCGQLLITRVDAADPEATVFFPNIDKLSEFKIVSETEDLFENNYKFRFITYERITDNE